MLLVLEEILAWLLGFPNTISKRSSSKLSPIIEQNNKLRLSYAFLFSSPKIKIVVVDEVGGQESKVEAFQSRHADWLKISWQIRASP